MIDNLQNPSPSADDECIAECDLCSTSMTDAELEREIPSDVPMRSIQDVLCTSCRAMVGGTN
jgi:hypothetical protein